MVFTDYYKTLDIELTATAEQIKAAHRIMSKRFHPDVNVADEFYEERFKDVQEAYQVLSDSKSRRLYDRVYHRYSRQGIAAGNVIHIPDHAAGKTAYSWHPDYKELPVRSLVGKRTSLLLGLVVVAVTGACAILFWGKEPKSRALVADAEVFKVAPAIPPPDKPQPAIAAPVAIVAGTDTPPVSRSSVSALSATAGKHNERPSPVITLPVNHVWQSLPASQTAQSLRLPESLPTVISAVPVTVSPVVVKTAAPVSNGKTPRTDTDLSDLMVQRVTQVQYGYMTFVVKRTFLFFGRRPDQTVTVRYVSGIRLYKPVDVLNQTSLISGGAAECNSIETSQAPIVGDFRVRHIITGQSLKIFATEAAASAALKSEGRVTRLKM